MVEYGGTLLPIEVRRVGARQTCVERVFDGELDLRTALDFCRQFSASNALSRFSRSRATFFTSARSSALNSGAGRVRMSKVDGLPTVGVMVGESRSPV